MAKCTLKDVAKACNVSAYTVSRAINNKKDISKETKDKILAVAKKMGYVANIGARNLRVGSTNNIAIIYDDFENPYYNLVIKELATKLYENGFYMTLFYDFDSISLLNTKLLKRVISSNIDGIISLIGITENAIKFNKIWKKPLIQIGSASLNKEVDCIYFDDYDGGLKLCNYVINRGYKNIGFINATEKLSAGMERIKGYKKALKDNNFEIIESRIIQLEQSDLTTEEATQVLLNQNCDCIIAYNDMTALTIKKYLKKNRIYNVLVCGFDNIQRTMPLPEPLISVYGDIKKIVEITVETLIKRINEESNDVINIKMPVQIYK